MAMLKIHCMDPPAGGTSIVWVRYMAFHLKMSDLEKARQVAERAVKHVGISEVKDGDA